MKNIAVAGRGSIGLLIALELHKKYPDIDITLYGEISKFSASYAAGAMINILSEIDCFNIDNPLNKWKLNSILNMEQMFFDCRSFNQSLNDWVISEHVNTNSMFYDARSLEKKNVLWYDFNNPDKFKNMNINLDFYDY